MCEYSEHLFIGGTLNILGREYKVDNFSGIEIKLVQETVEEPKDEEPPAEEPEPEFLNTKLFAAKGLFDFNGLEGVESIAFEATSASDFPHPLPLPECPWLDPGAIIKYIYISEPNINSLEFAVVVTSPEGSELEEPMCEHVRTNDLFEFMNSTLNLKYLRDDNVEFYVK